MKYQRKDTIIEAIQFTRDNFEEVCNFTNGRAHSMITERRPDGDCRCLLTNNSGWDTVVPEYGYILKTEDDDLLFLNQHYFEKTYEKVEE